MYTTQMPIYYYICVYEVPSNYQKLSFLPRQLCLHHRIGEGIAKNKTNNRTRFCHLLRCSRGSSITRGDNCSSILHTGRIYITSSAIGTILYSPYGTAHTATRHTWAAESKQKKLQTHFFLNERDEKVNCNLNTAGDFTETNRVP